jgi:cytochrome oxidase Cu insertion factor (SCO1/SenC/PrrC family)
MPRMTDPDAPRPIDRRAAIAGALLLIVVAAAGLSLGAVVWLDRSGALPVAAAPTASPSPTPAPGTFAYAAPGPAAPLALTDQDGAAFHLESLRGQPALVFFGYTHCPDVCPATVGVIDQVLDLVPTGPRAVFVSIDPERDDPAAMKQYLHYLPAAYIGLSGSPLDTRRTADAWKVSYARIDTGSASGYAMAHTADVYLVDSAGYLRAHFPFGTGPAVIAAGVQAYGWADAGSTGGGPVAGSPAPGGATGSAGPSPSATAAGPSPSPAAAPATVAPVDAAATLRPTVVSTSVWSGGRSPLILSLQDADGQAVTGDATRAWIQLTGPDGERPALIEAARVRPPGRLIDMYVATVDVSTAGTWQLDVTATDGSRTLTGATTVTVDDPGATAPLGAHAPTVRTPTVADVAGKAARVTTDPAPDPRLSDTSTVDAMAAGQPFVLVVDSWRFRITSACGRAIQTARYLADRWPMVDFIHLEPYRYSLITEQPTLDGDGITPVFDDAAAAWGLGVPPHDQYSVPWVFIVDGAGIVRAKYHGVFGTDEVDIIVSQILGQTNG